MRLVAAWLLNLAYVVLLGAVSPVLLYRSITQGKYRSGWSQKFWGNVPDWPASIGLTSMHAGDRQRLPRFWFHAVSVGEVLLLQSIIPEIKRRQPLAEILISTTTTTGQAVAREKFPDCRLIDFPLDFSWAVNRAIRRVRPTQIVLVELELWPNFVMAAKSSGIPLAIINARLSAKSFRGYSRFRWLMRPLLESFDTIAVQNATYASRFESLGADRQRLCVTGSVKYDAVETNRANARTTALRLAFGIQPGERVFVAGSTQEPEERIAIEVWRQARRSHPELRLILVPRHKERFEQVARWVQNANLPLLRRSHAEASVAAQGESPVLLLDTLGELAGCWGLADFAFVGGSLSNRGGQNMIEPAGYGAAVCFGPNTRNFRDIVESLLDRNAACVVRDQEELLALLESWLKSPQDARDIGRRAQEFVLTQRGASQRTVDLLVGDAAIKPARAA